MEHKRLTLFAGHYGSGKTNIAVNYAIALAKENKSVCIADLDIVNPYFRTADSAQRLQKAGVELISPQFANSNVDLYRDHTHLSDYGCLLVAYAWYAQFTGNPVTQINIDVIDAAYRQSQYQNLGPMIMTEEMKQAIIQTVDYTLNNPWTVPTE